MLEWKGREGGPGGRGGPRRGRHASRACCGPSLPPPPLRPPPPSPPHVSMRSYRSSDGDGYGYGYGYGGGDGCSKSCGVQTLKVHFSFHTGATVFLITCPHPRASASPICKHAPDPAGTNRNPNSTLANENDLGFVQVVWSRGRENRRPSGLGWLDRDPAFGAEGDDDVRVGGASLVGG